ncbi:MAG: anthrone oxygenase family protein [Ferruginibacter sp.]
MKTILLFTTITITAGLILVNIYTSLVDATSWGSNIPNSIAAAREYFKTVNPGYFFRIFSPVNQLLGLIVLIIFWKSAPATRLYFGLALVMYLAAEAMTFGYFYPRNDIMFKTAQLTDVELLKKTWSEWNTMNWVRTLLLLIGLFLSFLSLQKIYSAR